jgi:kynureninase
MRMNYFSAEFARDLDEENELKNLRENFHIPLARDTATDSEIEDDRLSIYFNGNSLGCQPKSTDQNVQAVLTNWKTKKRFQTF